MMSSSSSSVHLSADDRVRLNAEFASIALSHLPAIARLAEILAGQGADAADLVQETFLRAYLGWHTFTVGTDCRRWLSTICRNTFFEHRKREQRSTAVDDHELESLAAARLHNSSAGSGVDQLFSRLDLGPAIARAVAALETHYRLVVVLVDIEGFSYEEVAEALELPVGTVRSRLYRGRRILQEALLAFAVDAGFATARDRVVIESPSSAPQVSSVQNQSECEATVRRMWTYLDGRCSVADGQRVAEHLDACLKCASHFEFATDFLRALAAAPVFSEFDGRLRGRVVGVLADAGFGGR